MKLLKGLLTVFAVCVILPATTKADVELQGNVGGGIVIPYDDADNGAEWNTGANINFGGLAAFSLNEAAQLTGGISVAMHTIGQEYEEEFLGETIEAKTSISAWSIQIPISARYYIQDGFYGHLGIQPGIVLSRSGTTEMTIAGETEEEDLEDDDIEGYEDFEFSIPLGLGYRMDNGLDLSLTYAPLLTDMSEEDDIAVRRHTIRVGAGFFF